MTEVVQAAPVAFDGYSRLGGPRYSGSACFHAIAAHGYMACDAHSMVPGQKVPASTIAAALRCNRAACAKLFALADKNGRREHPDKEKEGA